MARNLSRNTKLIVSTVDVANDDTNTYEIPPLDGYSFSQDTAQQDITLNEAGLTPIRGTQSFNTGKNPADVTFTTYIRPFKDTNHSAVERILWGALVGTDAESATTVVQNATNMSINFAESNVSQLDKLFLWFLLDDVAYKISNFVLNSAEIDFSIDGIAQINWSGFGDSVTEDYTVKDNWVAGTDYLAATNLDGATNKVGEFIRNKLTTLAITDNNAVDAAAFIGATIDTAGVDVTNANRPILTIELADAGAVTVTNEHVGGFIKFTSGTQSGSTYSIVASANTDPDTVTILGPFVGTAPVATDLFDIYSNPQDHVGTVYTVPITGGTLTIDNGVTFLTPEELGVVNQPIDHFTGSRSITGTVTAYLSTGNMNTAGLLNTLSNDLDTVSNNYGIALTVGGGTAPNVLFTLGTAQLSIPSISTEDVISTEIGFTGQGSTGLEATDELTVVYTSSQA